MAYLVQTVHSVMFGSHLSIAGGMHLALIEAEKLGLETVQVFTKNQQQWKAPPLSQEGIAAWHAELKRLGWEDRTVSHASYLINLASGDDELWNKSIDLMTDEIERCAALSIPYLVQHPGSFVRSTLEDGLARIAAAYKELFTRTRGMKVVCCLEGTAGAGSHIGGKFEHLRDLRAMIGAATGQESRVGFCLDTCHLLVAGYDVRTKASAAAVLEEFDALCGLQQLKVWHLNDSKGKLGSHLDRHEHIGLGYVAGSPSEHTKGKTKAKDAGPSAREVTAKQLGASGFAAIMQHKAFAKVPMILETPKEEAKLSKTQAVADRWDVINASRLRQLAQK
jgi:deoxyribonuclease IV